LNIVSSDLRFNWYTRLWVSIQNLAFFIFSSSFRPLINQSNWFAAWGNWTNQLGDPFPGDMGGNWDISGATGFGTGIVNGGRTGELCEQPSSTDFGTAYSSHAYSLYQGLWRVGGLLLFSDVLSLVSGRFILLVWCHGGVLCRFFLCRLWLIKNSWAGSTKLANPAGKYRTS